MSPGLQNHGDPVRSDITWVHSFQVPWSKCTPQLLKAVDEKQIPAARDIRQLISHTMSDIFNHTRKPTRDNVRAIARKIIQKSPKSFADYINGQVVDDGTSSIMLMLESRKENLNRKATHHQPKSSDQMSSVAENMPPPSTSQQTVRKPSKSAMSYGCQNWDMPFPQGETVESLEWKQKRLQQLFLEKEDGCSPEVLELMRKTYSCQRYAINSQLTIREVLSEWPYLAVKTTMLQHFTELSGIDIGAALLVAVEGKSSLLYEFCKGNKVAGGVRNVLRDIDCNIDLTGGNTPIRDGFILLIMASLREDSKNMILFKVSLLCLI